MKATLIEIRWIVFAGRGLIQAIQKRSTDHFAMRREWKIAKVARKLAVLLYWMWRQSCDYGPWQKLGSRESPSELSAQLICILRP